MNVVAVGECTVDRYRRQGVERPGGISLNFAIHAARTGARVALVSAVGDDGEALIRAAARHAGVDDARLHRRPGLTATQLIDLGPDGERRFPPGGWQPGVLAGWRPDEGDAAVIAAAQVVAAPYFEQIAPIFAAAMGAAGPETRRVADLLDGADLGPGAARLDQLGPLDLAFLSGPPEWLDRLAPWADRSRATLVVTHGAGGATALVGGRRHHQPAIPVPAAEIIDSTGCGDAFQAAFSVTWFGGGSVTDALRAGAERAARVIRHLGAVAD